MRILLVEDDPITLMAIAMLLREDHGIEVIETTDGQRAVDLLMPEGKLDTSFSGIISDCHMYPGKSGIWLLQYLNQERVMLPFLLQSTNSTYREKGRDIDLRTIGEYFPFAEFHEKTGNWEHIVEFVNRLR